MSIITNYTIAGWFFAAAAASAAPYPSADVRATLPSPFRPGSSDISLPAPLKGEFGGLDKSSPYNSLPYPLGGAYPISIPSPLRGEGQGEGCFAQEGRILEGRNFVWGENAGWVNLRARHADLRVGSNVLAGWIWLENCGWVCVGDGRPLEGGRYSNSSASDWGINNDGRGNLSGYAWSELTGWINFGASHSRVSLEESGQFRGYAWGENVGWIQFCSGRRVRYLAKASPGPWKEIGTEDEGRFAGNGGGESYVRSDHVPISGLNHGSDRYDEHAGILCAGVVDEAGACGYVRVSEKPVYIDCGEERDYIRGPPCIGQHTLSLWWERAG